MTLLLGIPQTCKYFFWWLILTQILQPLNYGNDLLHLVILLEHHIYLRLQCDNIKFRNFLQHSIKIVELLSFGDLTCSSGFLLYFVLLHIFYYTFQ